MQKILFEILFGIHRVFSLELHCPLVIMHIQRLTPLNLFDIEYRRTNSSQTLFFDLAKIIFRWHGTKSIFIMKLTIPISVFRSFLFDLLGESQMCMLHPIYFFLYIYLNRDECDKKIEFFERLQNVLKCYFIY